jgi:hypothetical protein
VLGASLFALAAAVVTGRIVLRLDPTSPPWSGEEALVDFRDAVYYPVVAWLDGENPYARERMLARYPVEGTIGLYSPVALVLHLPWGMLPYRAAEAAFVAASLGLMVVLSLAAWRMLGRRPEAGAVLAFAAFLVITRPGHWNLYLGQVALEAGLATLAALWWAREAPWRAGAAFAVATFKPTYGLPLLALMAARADRRALGVGIAGAAVVTLAVLATLVAGGDVGAFASTVLGNYEARVATRSMSPAHSPFRVDVVALVSRFAGAAPGIAGTLALGALVLVPAALVLRRIADRSDRPSRVAALTVATLAIVLCAYRQQYDLVMLAPLLLTALPLRPLRAAQAPALLAAVPFGNYLASGVVQRATGAGDATILALSSLNGLALLAAFAMALQAAWRRGTETA